MKQDSRARNHPAYWAFMVHRLSGLFLVLFLPLHFWALGQALHGEAALDVFLRWTEQPLVKAAEWGLVVLLAAHLGGGLRVLALFLPLHFWALGLALQGEARLDTFLRWSEQPATKVAETILVVLLAAHMTGGLRLLALEFLAWRGWHKNLLAAAAGVTLAAGLAFLLNLF